MRILKLTEDTRNNILENLLKRSPNSYGEFEGRVNSIIEEVRAKKDEAIFAYTKQFDGADINASNILVTEEEINEISRETGTEFLVHYRERDYFRTESHCIRESRGLCTRRKSSISFLRSYERSSGKSSRS